MSANPRCSTCRKSYKTWAAAYACRCTETPESSFKRQQEAEMRAERAMDDRYTGTSD